MLSRVRLLRLHRRSLPGSSVHGILQSRILETALHCSAQTLRVHVSMYVWTILNLHLYLHFFRSAINSYLHPFVYHRAARVFSKCKSDSYHTSINLWSVPFHCIYKSQRLHTWHGLSLPVSSGLPPTVCQFLDGYRRAFAHAALSSRHTLLLRSWSCLCHALNRPIPTTFSGIVELKFQMFFQN